MSCRHIAIVIRLDQKEKDDTYGFQRDNEAIYTTSLYISKTY